ncbi:hypothetical protein [Actinomycetospora cinnamomea]|uniref:Uncharacterized protein n=1 Tax=Actinomycetospora cinnamomea TaxID=663609 RepID=A0A2U1F6I0_9PSEU|nr:hypothetical protein [Actinomycetospora cinnamomea]PVZ07779.1 hypothetical protein C8D89_111150 [Actinomycetospora cinnamomea]
MSAGPAPANTVAQLLRPASRPRAAAVDAEDREHAVTVVAHLLHAECEQWSWTVHHADVHRPEALRIVGALAREGWAPGPAA